MSSFVSLCNTVNCFFFDFSTYVVNKHLISAHNDVVLQAESNKVRIVEANKRANKLLKD